MADLIPDPAVYQAETAQALQAYQTALNAISQRRSNTLQNYGFTAKVNPNTGQLQNYSIDSGNQYGAVQQLLGSEGSNVDLLRHASIARGIGSLGLGAQALARYRTQMGGEQANLGRQFVGEIGSEANDQLSALQGYNSAKVQAQRDALATAIQNGWFTAVDNLSNSFQQAQPSQEVSPPPLTSAPVKPVNVKGTRNAAAGFFALNPVAARGI